MLDRATPLEPSQARKLVREILDDGEVVIGDHAHVRNEEREITAAEIHATLRGGVCLPAEWNQAWQEWRYRFETSRIAVVIAFDSETQCIVVTTIRLRKE